ncbi:MAG: hypothetical protein FJ147_17705 [Deltaproteobacteria bacterium]|nr:hypothetical protein [Deltaproteobacteria bacterium]
MTDIAPLDIPASTAGTTEAAAPVYRYLMQQPDHWMRQAFFVGRPKLPISRVVESMQANTRSIEETAQEWSLPIAAITDERVFSEAQRLAIPILTAHVGRKGRCDPIGLYQLARRVQGLAHMHGD